MFLDVGDESSQGLSSKGSHRTKIRNMPLQVAMVTRLLNRKDPEYHSREAKEALQKELTKLLTYKVWDMEACEEWDEVRKKHKDASIARIFPIISIKHAETGNPKYKGRIVLQGSDVRDTEGNTALFIDISASPSNLNTMCELRRSGRGSHLRELRCGDGIRTTRAD